MARLPVFIAAGILWMTAVSGAAAISPPSGDLRPDALEDLAPHLPPGRAHNEFWTYQFWLNGGIQAQVSLSRASFGSFKSPVCGADFALMGFNGRDFFVAREYPSENFAFDAAAKKMAVHERIFFEGFPPSRHRLFFSTMKSGVSYLLDLSFEEMVPGAAWGDGVFRLGGGDRVGLFFHIPRARVRGRVAVNEDTLEVEGLGWMDHTFQTDFATRLVDAGYRYAVISRTETGFFLQNDGAVFGYGLRAENGRMTLLKPEGLTIRESTPWGSVQVPRRLDISLEGGGSLNLERQKDRQKFSAFQELNRMERFGARLLLGGEILNCRGTARANDSPALFSFILVKH